MRCTCSGRIEGRFGVVTGLRAKLAAILDALPGIQWSDRAQGLAVPAPPAYILIWADAGNSNSGGDP
jgi:hypothetical protein